MDGEVWQIQAGQDAGATAVYQLGAKGEVGSNAGWMGIQYR